MICHQHQSSHITSKMTTLHTHTTVTQLLTQNGTRKCVNVNKQSERIWHSRSSSHKDLARSHPPRGWARLRTWQKRARTVLWCRRQRPANGRLHGVAQPKRVTLHCLVRLLINKMTQSAHQVEQEHDTSSKTDNGFATIRTQTQVSGYFPHKTPQLQN